MHPKFDLPARTNNFLCEISCSPHLTALQPQIASGRFIPKRLLTAFPFTKPSTYTPASLNTIYSVAMCKKGGPTMTIEKNEASYLENTLKQLNTAYTHVTKDISQKDTSYTDLKQYMVDYNNELDKMEVYDYQQSLSMIDRLGVASLIAQGQIQKLIDSPYFGRFDFVYEGEKVKDAEAFYIGRYGFSDEDGNNLIYDWRAPVCNMYYEFELGDAYYIAKERQFDGALIGKRQFKIENSKVIYMVDSSVTIQDAILQKTLSEGATEKMKTIVASIQREQNRIVRNESAYNVVIQGVAGSGKTAVALHRIAYLLYKYRDTLRPENIFILSPNKVFGDYISTVLPELGEQPICSYTLDELTQLLLPNNYSFTPFEKEVTHIMEQPLTDPVQRTAWKSDFTFYQKLETFLQQLNNEILKNEAISISDYIMEADYLQGRFLQYKKEPVLTRLELLADDILAILKTKRQGELKLPSKNEVIKRLKKRLTVQSPMAIYKAFYEQLGEDQQFIFKKQHFEFADVYPYLYCQLFFEGIKTYEAVQHFVLDEMQDYTPIQYAVLQKVFACKRTIIGDFSQALLPFETISKEAFGQLFTQLEYVELTTSYRSSYEISMYTQKFLQHVTIQPIARHGEAPQEIEYASIDEMIALIKNHSKNSYKTTAIICKTNADLVELEKMLTDVPFTILDGDAQTFETGTLLTTIQYAKGLEFDAVIIPYVDSKHYETSFDCGLLYIACTRAMHQLTLLKDATNPSPLL